MPVEPVKRHPFIGQTIHIWRPDLVIPMYPHSSVPLIVRNDKNDIGSVFLIHFILPRYAVNGLHLALR